MCVEDQDILGSATAMQKFLSLIPEETMRQELEKELQNHSTSKERWKAVVEYVTERRQKVVAMYLTFVITIKKKKKEKQSHHRPGVALRVPGS